VQHCRENPQWQEYQDPGKGNYRAALIVDNQLETVIFISADNQLPERSWLTSLFIKEQLETPERMALLTGIPPLGVPDVGIIVCACFNVGEKTIRTAIREKGLKTHQEVGLCLKAGTNCGSCVPEIKTCCKPKNLKRLSPRRHEGHEDLKPCRPE